MKTKEERIAKFDRRIAKIDIRMAEETDARTIAKYTERRNRYLAEKARLEAEE